MKLKFLRHKWHKAVFNFVLIPTAIILIIAITLNFYLSPILANEVREAVANGSDGLYKANFDDAQLHILEGKLTIFNISLIPDTAVYNRKKRMHLAPNNLITLHVKRLILLHVHPVSFYLRHKLIIEQVILNEPELNISYQLNHTKDTVDKDHRTAWQKISKTLHSIRVDHIELNNVKFKYEDYSGNKVVISELKEMNLNANNLLIDSSTQTDRSRLLYCKDVVTELNNYTGKTTNGLYEYKIKYLKLSTLTSKLNIRGLQVEPAKTSLFIKRSTNDRFTLNLDSLQLNNFNFLSFHKYRKLIASSLKFSNGTLRIFGNPKPSQKLIIDKVSTYPNIIIHNLKTDLKIDTVSLRRFNLVYTENNARTKTTGTISFNNTSGYFYNVTTNEAAILKNNITDVKLTTYLMDQGKLDVQFRFNLNDKDASFSYKGTLGEFSAGKLNRATMPLAMLKINSGIVKQFSFDIQANKDVFKGNVSLLYNNLKVSILKADTANNQLKKQHIVSIFANLFVIKHNNPDTVGLAPRVAEVNFTRPKEFPFFKAVWKALQAGIKPCVGLDDESRKAVNNRLSEHKRNKQERLTNKAGRVKRRAERKLQKAEKKI